MGWSLCCLGLHIIEILVLAEIVYFDRQRSGLNPDASFLEIFFVATIVMTIGFTVGMWMTARGHYRLGGIVQIIMISPQVLKLDGIVGVIGGIKAIRYAKSRDKEINTS